MKSLSAELAHEIAQRTRGYVAQRIRAILLGSGQPPAVPSSSPWASMTAHLTHQAGPGAAAAEPPVNMLREASCILRGAGGPGALFVAKAIDAWLKEGGDLSRLLEIKSARGGSYGLPHRQAQSEAVGRTLRQLAAAIAGKPQQQARAISELIRQRAPAVLALHQEVEALPTSAVQIARILRGS